MSNNHPLVTENLVGVTIAGVVMDPREDADDVTAIQLNQCEDIDVESGGEVNADAGGNLYLGSEQNLLVNYIEAGGKARIKTGQAIINVAGDGITNIRSAGLVLEAAGGPIWGHDGVSQTWFYVDLTGSGTLTARANDDIFIYETNGDMEVEEIFSKTGEAYLKADYSIVDARDHEFTNIMAKRVELTAGCAIGENGDYLDVDVSSTSGTLTATAQCSIWLAETEGDMNVRNVLSRGGDVDLKAQLYIKDAVDLVDPYDPDSGDTADSVSGTWPRADVIGKNITLTSDFGGIGVFGNELDIDSAYQGSGLVTSSSHLDNIYIIETTGDLTLHQASAGNYTTFLTAPGGSIFNGYPGGSNVVSGKTKLIAAQHIGESTNPLVSEVGNLEGYATTGCVWIVNYGSLQTGGVTPGAETGISSGCSVDIQASSPLTVTTNITAPGPVNLRAYDDGPADVLTINPNVTVESTGSSVILQGGDGVVLAYGGIVRAATDLTIRLDCTDTVDDPICVNGDPEGGNVELYGQIYAQNIQILGDNDDDVVYISPQNSLVHTTFQGGEGDDTVTLHDLKPTSILSDTVDLDGQGGNDLYIVDLSGASNYIVNIEDSGANDNGVDKVIINGTSGDDTFLLRSRVWPDKYDPLDEPDTLPAFVALITNEGTTVERINYDQKINGRLRVNAWGGNDGFYVDDNASITTLDGGDGEDYFQFGQIFKSARVAGDDPDTPPGFSTGIAAGDVFATIETTRGFLSNGVSRPLTAMGGAGEDVFQVYHNLAVLRLEGNDDDDTFIVRAFVILDELAKQAMTYINSGKGYDKINYVVNAPVSIDGGDGFDTVVIVGTEFHDNFVVTKDGVYGAGLNVSYENVEQIALDGMEGDDNFYILSTSDEWTAVLIGNKGSDTFNVAGDVDVDIISNDLLGVSGTIHHTVTTQDPDYSLTFIEDVVIHAVSNENSAVIIDETSAKTQVDELGSGGTTDVYNVKLAKAPTETVYLTISAPTSQTEEAAAGGETLEISTDGVIYNFAVVLVFTAANYDQPQQVTVRASHDTYVEGDRYIEVSHAINSEDEDYNDLAIRNVRARVRDNDRDGLIFDQTDYETEAVESGANDTYEVTLTHAPSNSVTVNLDFDGAQMELRDAADTVITSLTFTPGNWNIGQEITVIALEDGKAEGKHLETITHQMSSADGDFDGLEEELDITLYDKASVKITESNGTTYVIPGATDGSQFDDYEVVLTTQPNLNAVIEVYVNDRDIDDNLVETSTTITDDPDHGTASVDTATGNIEYLPTDPGYVGTDTIKYQICDSDGQCDEAIVTIHFNPAQDNPVAESDTATTDEDVAVNIPVLDNDLLKGTGHYIDLLRTTDPEQGTVALGTDPLTVDYTPDPDANGSDTFSYMLCNAEGGCAMADVTVDVTPINDAPVTRNDLAVTLHDTEVTFSVDTNDFDIDELDNVNATSVTVVAGPTHGTVDVTGSGEVEYTPTAGYYGEDTLTYQICDFNGGCTNGTVTIQVNGDPEAVDDTDTTSEDTAVDITVLDNDTTPGTEPLEIDDVANSVHGSLTFTGTTITYTPDQDWNGTDTFTYRMCNAGGWCDTAEVTVTVTAVNDAPIVEDDLVVTGEDDAITFSAAANDSDVDHASSNLYAGSIETNSAASEGTATIETDGTITFTPAADFSGDTSFTYKVCDLGDNGAKGGGDDICSTAAGTVNVHVNSEVTDDAETTDEDTPIDLSVLDNDQTPGTVDLEISGLTQPGHGTTKDNGDGTITYTPDPDWNGTDTFTYLACNNVDVCDTAEVTLTVTAVNDAPVAGADVSVTSKGDTDITFSVDGNDDDVDHDTADLYFTNVTDGTHGTVTITADGNVTYTLKTGGTHTGQDDFTYDVCDLGDDGTNDSGGGDDLCTEGIVYMAINASGTGNPAASADTGTTNEDTAINIQALANDTGTDLEIYQVSDPLYGTVSVNGAKDTLTYTPDADSTEADAFTYLVCSAADSCDTATVDVSVTAVNDDPVAAGGVAVTETDTAVDFTVSARDVDDNLVDLTFSKSTDPVHGTVTVDADGSVTYTPDAAYTGADTFTYQVCDDDADCDTATVNLNVNGELTITADTGSTDEETAVDISVLDNDQTPGTASLTISGITQPGHGTTTDNGDGTIEYAPDADWSGTDTFTYLACNAADECDTAQVTVTVDNTNDTPVVQDDLAAVREGESVTLSVLNGNSAHENDYDIDPGDSIDQDSLSIVTSPDYGTVDIGTGQSLTYTHTGDGLVNPSDSFEYEVCDTHDACQTAIVSITINADPVAGDDTDTTDEDTAVQISVLDNDDTLGTNPLEIRYVTQGQQGTVVINSGTITYTPDPDVNGSDFFYYMTCNAGDVCATARVDVTIDPVNDAPVAYDDPLIIDSTVIIDIAASDPSLVVSPTRLIFNADNWNIPQTVTVEGVSAPEGDPDVMHFSASDHKLDSIEGSVEVIGGITGDDRSLAAAVMLPGETNLYNPTGEVDEATNTTLEYTSDIFNDDLNKYADKGIMYVAILDDVTNEEITIRKIAGYFLDRILEYESTGSTGVDTFTYEVCDDGQDGEAGNGDDECGTATIYVAVNASGDAATAVDDAVTTDEDTGIAIHALNNDTAPSQIAQITQPAFGTADIDPTQHFITYTPDPNFNGEDRFEYMMLDTSGVYAKAEIVVTVNAVNDAPIARDDLATTLINEEVEIPVPLNDDDVEIKLDVRTVEVTISPTDGHVSTPSIDGLITYTPNTDFVGEDTFTYKICDTAGTCSTAVVTLIVNDDVIANPDAVDAEVTTNEDVPVVINVIDNDTYPGVTPYQVTDTTLPAYGLVSIGAGGQTITYTPDPDTNGIDTFTYLLCDADTDPLTPMACDTAEVHLTIDPVNDAPVPNTVLAVTNQGDSVQANIPVNNIDPEANIDFEALSIDSTPGEGSASIIADTANNIITLKGDAWRHIDTDDPIDVNDLASKNFVVFFASPTLFVDEAEQTDTLNIWNDGSNLGDTGHMTDTALTGLNMGGSGNDGDDPTDPNDATEPAITYIGLERFNIYLGDGADTLHIHSTPEGTLTNIQGNQEGDVFNLNSISGDLRIDASAGEDIFNIEVQLPVDIPAASLANVTLNGDADDDTFNLKENGVPASLNFTMDGGAGDDTWVFEGAWGQIDALRDTGGGEDTLDFAGGTPGASALSEDQRFSIFDELVSVSIGDIDPYSAIANDDLGLTEKDTQLSIDVTANDRDIDRNLDATSVTIITPPDPAQGTALFDSFSGEVIFTPAAGFTGTATFTYQICDIDDHCDTAAVQVSVTEDHINPIPTDDTATTGEDAGVVINPLANDGNPAWTVDSYSHPKHGSLEFDPATGTFIYTPDADYYGEDAFTYSVCTTPADCGTATVSITVDPVDDLPIANSLVHRDNTIEILIGSQADDSFNFADGASLATGDTGTTYSEIDGQGGAADLLNYIDYSAANPVTVNLNLDQATGVSYVTNLENVTGGDGDDSLTGDAGTNVLRGSFGADTLIGLAGNDYYSFVDGWGADTVVEEDGGGEDVLNFYAYVGDTVAYVPQPVTADLDFRLDNAALWDTVTDVADPTNTLQFSSRHIEYAFGGIGSDSLYTLDQDSTFNIDGVIVDTDPLFTPDVTPTMVAATDRNTYTELGAGYDLEFANFERLFAGNMVDHFTLVEDEQRYMMRGGPGDDIWTFNAGAGVGGAPISGQIPMIDGQGGRDTLDYALYNTPVSVDLSLTLAEGVNGGVPMGVLGSVINMENLIGGSGADTLTGDAGDNEITGGPGDDTLSGLGGNDRYIFADNAGVDTVHESANASVAGTDTLDFSQLTVGHALHFALNLTEMIIAEGANIVTHHGRNIENLIGGAGDDVFDFAAGVDLTGYIDAQGGYNTLDYSDYLTALDVYLTGLGLITGFNGTETSILGGFRNLNAITAGQALTDSITGLNANADWLLDGTDQYTSTNTLDFGAFEILVGGDSIDTFHISGVRTYHALRGGAGDDVFDFASGATLTLITALGQAGYVDGQGGIDALDYADFTAAEPVFVDLPPGVATALSNDNAGDVGAILNIENAIGGAADDDFIGDSNNNTFWGNGGNDRFDFLDNWGLDEVFDSAGIDDWLNFSQVTMALTITLGSVIVTSGGSVLTHQGNDIERILGGQADDQFVFSADGVTFAHSLGTLDGNTGVDVLDYSAYTSPVTVNLTTGAATGTGGVSNIENVFGGSGNDTLTGDGGDNVLRGDAGDDEIDGAGGTDTLDESDTSLDLSINLGETGPQNTGRGLDTILNIENVTTGDGNDTLTGSASDNVLSGGLGNDHYIFADNAGTDIVVDLGGDDTIDLTPATLAVTFDLANSTVFRPPSSVTYAGSAIENLIGSQGDDIFDFSASATHAGDIDGGPSTGSGDTLDYSGYGTPVTVDLESMSATGLNAFTNIENLIGSPSTGSGGDTILAANAGTIYEVTGLNEGRADGLNFTSYETLTGRAGDDTLSFNGYTSGRDIILIGPGAVDGFDGTESSLSGGFYNINTLIGSPFTDTLIGPDDAMTWEIGNPQSVIRYTQYPIPNNILTFSAIENLQGGSGIDVLDYAAYTTPVSVDFRIGTATDVAGTFTGIENATGGSAGDTFTSGAGNETMTGGPGDDHYLFHDNWGIDTVVELAGGGTDTMDFSAVTGTITIASDGTTLTVSDGTSTATHTGNQVENIIGTATGTNSLDFGTSAIGHEFTLTALGTDIGFMVNITGVGTFDNINDIVGSAAAGDDILNTLDAASAWAVETTTSTYTSTNALTFTQIDIANAGATGDDYTISGTPDIDLNGGGGDDTFVLTDGASLAGLIDGGAGDDTLDHSGYSTPVTVDLETMAATGVGGFTNLETLLGSPWGDTILAADAGSTFVVTGQNSGTADGINFTSYETLTGGPGNDTIDWSAYATARDVTITGPGAVDGFDGTEASLSGGFQNVNTLIGSTYNDSLNGPNADMTWTIDNPQSTLTNTQYPIPNNLLSFSAFELLFGGGEIDTFTVTGVGCEVSLRGGPGSDIFEFEAGASITGVVDGQGASESGNILDYSAYVTPVMTNLHSSTGQGLLPFTSTGIGGGVFNIQNLLGGSADDVLIGTSGDNVITGNGGSDYLAGMFGDDTYIFADGWGLNDIVAEGVDEGDDTMDFAGATRNLTFTLASVTVTDGFGNTATHADDNVEHLIGGSGDDTFTFSAEGVTFASGAGTLNGNTGIDTIDYSAYTSGVDINLADGTSTGTGSITNIENATGGAGDDVLTGSAADNVLNGQAGDDTYRFRDNAGADLVIDPSGDDTIDLSPSTGGAIFDLVTSNIQYPISNPQSPIPSLLLRQPHRTSHRQPGRRHLRLQRRRCPICTWSGNN